jgi:hypothetical protein
MADFSMILNGYMFSVIILADWGLDSIHQKQ